MQRKKKFVHDKSTKLSPSFESLATSNLQRIHSVTRNCHYTNWTQNEWNNLQISFSCSTFYCYFQILLSNILYRWRWGSWTLRHHGNQRTPKIIQAADAWKMLYCMTFRRDFRGLLNFEMHQPWKESKYASRRKYIF